MNLKSTPIAKTAPTTKYKIFLSIMHELLNPKRMGWVNCYTQQCSVLIISRKQVRRITGKNRKSGITFHLLIMGLGIWLLAFLVYSKYEKPISDKVPADNWVHFPALLMRFS